MFHKTFPAINPLNLPTQFHDDPIFCPFSPFTFLKMFFFRETTAHGTPSSPLNRKTATSTIAV